ncbi:MAG: hypothetical protein ABI851_09975 [Saprospiraceae bacterium]
MSRISSASTLFFAVFLPVFWFVFFGSLALALMVIEADEIQYSFFGMIKWIMLSLFILFCIIIYRTILRLKRVDADDDFVYVSNYVKTIRIPYEQIESISCKSLSVRQLAKIQLKHKGRFGENIYFLCESEKFEILDHLWRSTIV